jgi:hypothetical protein
MGSAKNAMIEHDENLATAAAYLVKLGNLEECEAHGVIYGGGFWDLEDDFWKKVMIDRNRGDLGPIPWALEMQAREFTDLLKEAYNTHTGDGCAQCEKIMAE